MTSQPNEDFFEENDVTGDVWESIELSQQLMRLLEKKDVAPGIAVAALGDSWIKLTALLGISIETFDFMQEAARTHFLNMSSIVKKEFKEKL